MCFPSVRIITRSSNPFATSSHLLTFAYFEVLEQKKNYAEVHAMFEKFLGLQSKILDELEKRRRAQKLYNILPNSTILHTDAISTIFNLDSWRRRHSLLSQFSTDSACHSDASSVVILEDEDGSVSSFDPEPERLSHLESLPAEVLGE